MKKKIPRSMYMPSTGSLIQAISPIIIGGKTRAHKGQVFRVTAIHYMTIQAQGDLVLHHELRDGDTRLVLRNCRELFTIL